MLVRYHLDGGISKTFDPGRCYHAPMADAEPPKDSDKLAQLLLELVRVQGEQLADATAMLARLSETLRSHSHAIEELRRRIASLEGRPRPH